MQAASAAPPTVVVVLATLTAPLGEVGTGLLALPTVAPCQFVTATGTEAAVYVQRLPGSTVPAPRGAEMSDLVPPDDPAAFTRSARRWADAACVRGWHAHALDVLDHAVRLRTDDGKLYRTRGAVCLRVSDPALRDLQQGYADLRRACELSGWQDDLVRWAADLLTGSGRRGEWDALFSERHRRGGRAAGGPDARRPVGL